MFPFKQNLRNKNKENNEFFLNYIKNFYSNKSLNITKNSKVSSIGSCFAREIKNYLIKKKYNYIQEEINTPRSIHSSCAWERVYNTFTLKKIFEYSFVNNFQMKYVVAKNNIVQEVTRTLTEYHSIEEAKQDFKKHAKISKNILMKSDIIIITLGLIEIWENNIGDVFSCPVGSYPNLNQIEFLKEFSFKLSSFKENFDNLVFCMNIIKKNNPSTKVILTLSPVSLLATNRIDVDILSANSNSKAVLRSVIDSVARLYDFVYYFPSYEIATIACPQMGIPTFDVNHKYGANHLNKNIVEKIMNTFESIHLLPENEILTK